MQTLYQVGRANTWGTARPSYAITMPPVPGPPGGHPAQ